MAMRGRTRGSGNGVRGQRVVLARARRSRPLGSRPRPALRSDMAGARNQALERIAKKSLRPRPDLSGRRPELQPAEEHGAACWFGATCVGVLLERLRLHLGTQRFLAARRGDRIWEAGWDYGALGLARLESRLRPGTLGAPLVSTRDRRLHAQRPRVSPTKSVGA